MRRVISLPFPVDPVVNDAATFGAAIRAARANSGMTLLDAALALDVAKQTLSDLETAKSSVGLKTVLHVAHEMGVTLFAIPTSEREIVRRAIAQARLESPVAPITAQALRGRAMQTAAGKRRSGSAAPQRGRV